MRKTLLILTTLALLAFINYGIVQREHTLTNGQIVLLELAPVDPRSLMQGDYMALRFAVANDAAQHLREQATDGHIVLTLDDKGVGRYARLDDGTPLAVNEIRMRYRKRDREFKFATGAYFFEEGTAQLYEPARYGEFRVAQNGEALLTGLRDGKLKALGPPAGL